MRKALVVGAVVLAIPLLGVLEPERRRRTNELMREKYGWADAYITFLFSRGDSVPIRLAPR